MADEKQIQELLAALDSDDIQVQIATVKQLADLQAVQAVPRLIELLKSEQHEVRLASIAALGKMGDGRAIPLLIEIVKQNLNIKRNLNEDIQREIQGGLLPKTNSQSLRNKLVEREIAEREIMEAERAISTILPVHVIAPPAEESEAEKQDALDDFYTQPMQPVELEESAPEPELFAPPAPVPAGPLLDTPDDFDDEAHTGSMEPLDWDESRAAEAPPAPKPVPLPRPIPSPAPAVSMPAQPQPVPMPDQSVSRQRRETETGGFGGDFQKKAEEAQQVQFSAYYPREIRPNEWQPLQAYVFKQFAAERVLEDAEKQLGLLDRFRQIVESARQKIAEGETITATPHLPGFQFNPPAISVGFFEDWHRFEFKMRAKDAPLNLAANGFLTFMAGGVIVADIPLSVFVTNTITQTRPQASEARPMYDTVFASYSHRDTAIVERVEAAARTFGMTYLRDVITLRSGEDWNEGLQSMIEQATIFQMFWSEPYSKSMHCQREWEHALNLKREGIPFIRPVYWLQPMPAPPAPLQHLHFAYLPDLVK